MNIIDDFEDIRDEVEEILDYSGFHLNHERYGLTRHIWETEDDDSDLNDDGGEYAVWLDLNSPEKVTAGTRDLFDGSQREELCEVFEFKEWRGWSGTVAEAVEWLGRWGLDPYTAEAVVDDIASIDEEIE